MERKNFNSYGTQEHIKNSSHCLGHLSHCLGQMSQAVGTFWKSRFEGLRV